MLSSASPSQLEVCLNWMSLREAVTKALANLRHIGVWNVELLNRKFRVEGSDDLLVLSAKLVVDRLTDATLISHICRLCLPNSKQFEAVVCIDEHQGCLVFIQHLARPGVAEVLRAMERMVNQIEVWRHLLTSTAPSRARG